MQIGQRMHQVSVVVGRDVVVVIRAVDRSHATVAEWHAHNAAALEATANSVS